MDPAKARLERYCFPILGLCRKYFGHAGPFYYSTLTLKTLAAERSSISMLSEYQKLTLRLQQEEFETAVNYKEISKTSPGLPPPITKIDIIQGIWEKMFPHNRLVRKSGFFELTSTSRDGDSYTAERMSDGEKIVFI